MLATIDWSDTPAANAVNQRHSQIYATYYDSGLGQGAAFDALEADGVTIQEVNEVLGTGKGVEYAFWLYAKGTV